MNISRRLFVGAGLALPLVMTRVAHGAVRHRLTILHMNDFHSRHEAVDGRALACKPGEKPDCFGGSAKLATALSRLEQAAQAAGRTVMRLDAGDQFQGSLFYTAWQGRVELEVMHVLGTEAMTIGNHEFDGGPEVLGRFIDGARFPILSANIDVSAEPALAGKIRPSIMMQKDGLKIGVVGATTLQTPVTSLPGPRVKFSDPGPALTREAAALRAQGAGLVIALSHLGVDVDQKFAGHITGVDVFVGGHTHTLLSDSEAGAAGPPLQAITGPAGTAVVVQASCYGRYVGRLDLDIDETGRVLAYGGDVSHVDLSLPDDPVVAKIIGGYAAQLDTVRNRVVGRADQAYGVETCRVAECALGSFLADSILATVHGADLAIINGGGLRIGLPAGDIKLGDVMGTLPYGNSVATVELRGADVAAAIANGVSRAGLGAFPQVAGMRFTWTPTAEPTKRLRRIDVRNPDGSFAPLDPERVYRVATHNYMRTGGDGYTVMRDRGMNPYDGGTSLDLLMAAAIGEAKPFAPVTDGRIGVE